MNIWSIEEPVSWEEPTWRCESYLCRADQNRLSWNGRAPANTSTAVYDSEALTLRAALKGRNGETHCLFFIMISNSVPR
jgi:hypothetical protein